MPGSLLSTQGWLSAALVNKGSPVYLGKALQGSFVEFAYNYACQEGHRLPRDGQKRRAVRVGRAYTDVFDRLGVYIAPSYDLGGQQDAVHRVRRASEIAL